MDHIQLTDSCYHPATRLLNSENIIIMTAFNEPGLLFVTTYLFQQYFLLSIYFIPFSNNICEIILDKTVC